MQRQTFYLFGAAKVAWQYYKAVTRVLLFCDNNVAEMFRSCQPCVYLADAYKTNEAFLLFFCIFKWQIVKLNVIFFLLTLFLQRKKL